MVAPVGDGSRIPSIRSRAGFIGAIATAWDQARVLAPDHSVAFATARFEPRAVEDDEASMSGADKPVVAQVPYDDGHAFRPLSTFQSSRRAERRDDSSAPL